MSNIDTSTTAGKIAVMQAFEDGRLIEFNDQSGWCEMISGVNPAWHWVQCKYRIKPQTVEEAAEEHSRIYEGTQRGTYECGFREGAQFQKDQDNE